MQDISDERLERAKVLLKVERRILTILTGLTPDQRRRVLQAVAVIYGHEEAAGLRQIG